MRRSVIILYVVIGAAFVASFGALSAQAQSRDQYAPEEGTTESTVVEQTQVLEQTQVSPTEEERPEEERPEPPETPPPPPEDPVGWDAPGLEQRVVNKVAEDPYSQIVDDADRKRFVAPGWKRKKVAGAYGGALHKIKAEGRTKDRGKKDGGGKRRDARFKVRVPEAGYYTLYARWPAAGSEAARVGVATSKGWRWEKVDQTESGASWVRLGAFRMPAGDRFAVRVSGGARGSAVADAVMISRNVLVGKNAQMVSVGDPQGLSGAGMAAATGEGGGAIVRTARAHLGTPYDFDYAPCQQGMAREDCSCFTRNVFLNHGWTLPDSPVYQWRYGEQVPEGRMAPGDLVFHDLTRDGDLDDHYADHVSIYSGNGMIIHASSYFGAVVEKPERHLNDFWGARRLGTR